MTFTTFLTTSQFLFHSIGASTTIGLHRHIRTAQEAGIRRLTAEPMFHHEPEPPGQTTQESVRLEKRSFHGQGTYFYPGQGEPKCGVL